MISHRSLWYCCNSIGKPHSTKISAYLSTTLYVSRMDFNAPAMWYESCTSAHARTLSHPYTAILFRLIVTDFTRNTNTNEYEYGMWFRLYSQAKHVDEQPQPASVIYFLNFQSKYIFRLLDNTVHCISFSTSLVDWGTQMLMNTIQKTGVTFSHPIRNFKDAIISSGRLVVHACKKLLKILFESERKTIW